MQASTSTAASHCLASRRVTSAPALASASATAESKRRVPSTTMRERTTSTLTSKASLTGVAPTKSKVPKALSRSSVPKDAPLGAGNEIDIISTHFPCLVHQRHYRGWLHPRDHDAIEGPDRTTVGDDVRIGEATASPVRHDVDRQTPARGQVARGSRDLCCAPVARVTCECPYACPGHGRHHRRCRIWTRRGFGHNGQAAKIARKGLDCCSHQTLQTLLVQCAAQYELASRSDGKKVDGSCVTRPSPSEARTCHANGRSDSARSGWDRHGCQPADDRTLAVTSA